MSWTAPVTWTAGQVVGASDMNSQIRDNLLYLIAQTQVVNLLYLPGSNYSLTSTAASWSYVDSTNLKPNIATTKAKVQGRATFAVFYDDTTHVGNVRFAWLFDAVAVDTGSTTVGGVIVNRTTGISGGIIDVPFMFTSILSGSHNVGLVWQLGNTGASPAATIYAQPAGVGGVRMIIEET